VWCLGGSCLRKNDGVCGVCMSNKKDHQKHHFVFCADKV